MALPDLIAGGVWAAVALLTVRVRGSIAVLAALTSAAWFSVEVLPAAALWHRAVIAHLLLASPGWWPRSWTARCVLVVQYVAAVLIVPWTQPLGAVALSASLIVAFAVETAARSASAPRWTAIVLGGLAFALPPLLPAAVITGPLLDWAYAAGIVAIGLLTLADTRIRAAAAPLDRLVELGSAAAVHASAQEKEIAAELQASHDALVRELRKGLDELRASRRRLAEADLSTAADLADDIDDRVRGPLARLGALAAPRDRAAIRFDEARVHLVEAGRDIDGILRGLGPPSLSGGLEEGLTSLALASPIPTTVDISRVAVSSENVARTAYLICAEALANLAKHSGASAVRVSARPGPIGIEVVISDDGRGGADPRRGTGLTGMRDRAEAIGGRLEIVSTRAGTTVRAWLPDQAMIAAAVPDTGAPGLVHEAELA